MILLFDCLQRNHTLFGSVVSAMAGVRPILPFLNRTQSLYGNSRGGSPKTLDAVTSISAATAKLLGQANGGVGGATSLNHLNAVAGGDRNHAPSSTNPAPRPSLVVPAQTMGDGSRRPSNLR
jgi:hypothetical protein